MIVFALDDEKLSLMLLIEAVREVFPHDVVRTFRRAGDLLDALKEEVPDILCMDIEMPGINGIELAKAIRSTYPKTRIVFVTGYGRAIAKEVADLADGYVCKPVTPDQLRLHRNRFFPDPLPA